MAYAFPPSPLGPASFPFHPLHLTSPSAQLFFSFFLAVVGEPCTEEVVARRKGWLINSSKQAVFAPFGISSWLGTGPPPLQNFLYRQLPHLEQLYHQLTARYVCEPIRSFYNTPSPTCPFSAPSMASRTISLRPRHRIRPLRPKSSDNPPPPSCAVASAPPEPSRGCPSPPPAPPNLRQRRPERISRAIPTALQKLLLPTKSKSSLHRARAIIYRKGYKDRSARLLQQLPSRHLPRRHSPGGYRSTSSHLSDHGRPQRARSHDSCASPGACSGFRHALGATGSRTRIRQPFSP